MAFPGPTLDSIQNLHLSTPFWRFHEEESAGIHTAFWSYVQPLQLTLGARALGDSSQRSPQRNTLTTPKRRGDL